MPDAADPNTPPGDLKHSTRFDTTHASAYPMVNDTDGSVHQTPSSLQLTQVDPDAPRKDPMEQQSVDAGDMRQPKFELPGGGKKRRGKKSRKSRKGKKPRKGKKSRKNKRRTKRR